MSIANVITLLGGLAFFLFGMTLLSEGLKRVAGSKLEIILGKLTSNTFKGVLLGTLVTTAIQSSSATTVMVVGFVNTGIMKLANAIGIIMGANIGTTVTGWLLVLAGIQGKGTISSSTIFAFVGFVGIILYFFCKKSTLKNIGMILLAFSVLMNGMQSMSSAMSPLKEDPAFINFIAAVSHPAIALLVGLVVTAIIQSCSASIGILQALSVTGVISYDVAVPMVVGMCIGACAPILLSAIGANVNGKRAALIYPYFNIAGAILLMIPFYILDATVGFDFMSMPATSMGIAVVNTVFNAAATMILYPLVPLFEKLIVNTVKDKPGEEDDVYEDNLLDPRFLQYPALALEQSRVTIEQMTAAAFKNLRKSVELLHTFNPEKYDKIMSRESHVDRFEDVLGVYLVQLNANELSEKETQTAARYLNSLSNVERISDHAVNIADLAKELYDKRISFSPQAEEELAVCKDAILEILALTEKAMKESDIETAKMVEPLEEVVDALRKELKMRHIQRVQAGCCTLELGFIFNDCIHNFERVADHCSNIAVAVLEGADSHLQSHNYLSTIKKPDHEDYANMYAHFADKYCGALAAKACEGEK
ncbi:MAG: Na/Pi cotransporter family protein [Oscillospiraceae bacterium]|nr:Na/Pi cotransporter family protein [Oscillospiraceae bacterium]